MVQQCTDDLTAKEMKTAASASDRPSDTQNHWFNSPYYHFLATLGKKLDDGRTYEVGRRVEGERDEAELVAGLINKSTNTTNIRKLSFHYSDDNEEHKETGRDSFSRKRKASTD
jgi:hypothetical protein